MTHHELDGFARHRLGKPLASCDEGDLRRLAAELHRDAETIAQQLAPGQAGPDVEPVVEIQAACGDQVDVLIGPPIDGGRAVILRAIDSTLDAVGVAYLTPLEAARLSAILAQTAILAAGFDLPTGGTT